MLHSTMTYCLEITFGNPEIPKNRRFFKESVMVKLLTTLKNHMENQIFLSFIRIVVLYSLMPF